MDYTPAATSPTPSPPPSSSPSPPSKITSALKWYVIILMVVNILFVHEKLAPSKRKLADLSQAVRECHHSPDALSKFFVDEIVERTKENPSALPMMAYKAGRRVGLTFSSKDIVGDTNTSFIGLLPTNLFEVADNLIRANFSNVLRTSSNFTYQLSQGISTVFGDGRYYPGPAEWMLPASYVLGIMADHVQPLSNDPIVIDSSAFGNLVTNLPSDIEASLSNSKQIDMTSEDCEILMTRFYATTWDTYAQTHHCDGSSGLNHVGTGKIEVFRKIKNGCASLNYGF